MFPLNSNLPYIKDDGTRDKLGNVIGSGGSELPEYGIANAGNILSVDDTGELEWTEPELPEYGIDDAGKVLSVDDTGELEWISNGSGGGTTTVTDIPFSGFPYTATEKGFVSVFFMGSSSTNTNYYEGVALNNVNLLVPTTYNVSFNNKTCSILIPVNVGDIVSLPGNHEYLANTFNAKFIKS